MVVRLTDREDGTGRQCQVDDVHSSQKWLLQLSIVSVWTERVCVCACVCVCVCVCGSTDVYTYSVRTLSECVLKRRSIEVFVCTIYH